MTSLEPSVLTARSAVVGYLPLPTASAWLSWTGWPASAQTYAVPPPPLPTGQVVTPTAAPGAIFQSLLPGIQPFPGFQAGQAIRTVLSPDGKTLLVMTSGYNGIDNTDGSLNTAVSSEYIFVYDISSHAPVRRQVIHV